MSDDDEVAERWGLTKAELEKLRAEIKAADEQIIERLALLGLKARAKGGTWWLVFELHYDLDTADFDASRQHVNQLKDKKRLETVAHFLQLKGRSEKNTRRELCAMLDEYERLARKNDPSDWQWKSGSADANILGNPLDDPGFVAMLALDYVGAFKAGNMEVEYDKERQIPDEDPEAEASYARRLKPLGVDLDRGIAAMRIMGDTEYFWPKKAADRIDTLDSEQLQLCREVLDRSGDTDEQVKRRMKRLWAPLARRLAEGSENPPDWAPNSINTGVAFDPELHYENEAPIALLLDHFGALWDAGLNTEMIGPGAIEEA